MKISIQDKPALILIDFQKGFNNIDYWGGHRNNPDAENNAVRLLNFWRENNLPLFFTRHYSLNPLSPLAENNSGNDFKEMITPKNGEPVIKKNVNSAFIGTDLKEQLDSAGIKKLVIIGLITDHCVSTTTRMAGNYGYDTYVAHDATATFNRKGIHGETYSAELIHDTALASLNEEFATVSSTQELIEAIK